MRIILPYLVVQHPIPGPSNAQIIVPAKNNSKKIEIASLSEDGKGGGKRRGWRGEGRGGGKGTEGEVGGEGGRKERGEVRRERGRKRGEERARERGSQRITSAPIFTQVSLKYRFYAKSFNADQISFSN